MLSLRSLLIFRTVAQTGSFTKAAQELYITQSAVSHTIRELEETTGMVLFDRLSRRIELTANGRMLLQESAGLLAASEQLEKRIADPKAQAPIRIVSSITIACFWLPDILKRLKMRMPEVEVSVQVLSAAEALLLLQKGEAELAFVEGSRPQPPFTSRCFAEYRLSIVCAPDYLNTTMPITTGEFCRERLLLREPASAIRNTLDSQLFLLGYTARPLWQSVNSTALLEAAKAGIGIAILPENLVREELRKGTLKEITVEGLDLKNDMLVVWHRDKHLTAALQALLSCAMAKQQEAVTEAHLTERRPTHQPDDPA